MPTDQDNASRYRPEDGWEECIARDEDGNEIKFHRQQVADAVPQTVSVVDLGPVDPGPPREVYIRSVPVE